MVSKVPVEVIGLTGYAGVGKSYIAEHIAWEPRWTRLSFGSPIKLASEAVLRAAGINSNTNRYLSGDLKDVKLDEFDERLTSRDIQIAIGQGLRDKFQDIWVSILERKLCKLLLEGRCVVIDDVRQANEAALIRKYGGWVVRIVGQGKSVSDLNMSGVVADTAFENNRGEYPSAAAQILKRLDDVNGK